MIENDGPTTQAARARGEDTATAVLWACLAQFMLLFALDNPHSVSIHKKSIKYRLMG